MYIVCAIDGASGSGKSSTARALAKMFHLAYLDTGAMYRASAYLLLDKGFDLNDAKAQKEFTKIIANAIESTFLKADLDPSGNSIFFDGENVDKILRSDEITKKVSSVAKIHDVRDVLIAWQQSIIASEQFENSYSQGKGIVVEGRDITTVVAPDANVKILLKSDESIRANRRLKEENKKSATEENVKDSIHERDKTDSGVNDFFNPTKDTIVVDNSEMTLNETVDFISRIITTKTGIIPSQKATGK
jgi:GTP-binding protein